MAKTTSKTNPAIQVRSCTVRLLPKQQWIAAAAKAVEVNNLNAPAVFQLRSAMPGSTVSPMEISMLTTKYWGLGGVNLTVGFTDNPPTDLKKRILSHMNAWGKTANVKFVHSNVNPKVRISRSTPAPNDGYWSYLGTDILQIPASQPTMNLDSFTMQTPDAEFYRVVRHETGHTLGFTHEHMRAEIIERIDRERAIEYFMRTQGWTREDVIRQVLTPIDRSVMDATAEADANSIMCYWLPAEIMRNGQAVAGGRDINALDAKFAARIYPIKKKKPAKKKPAKKKPAKKKPAKKAAKKKKRA